MRLNDVLAEGGVSGGWQGLVARLAAAVLKAVAPQAIDLLERAVVAGSVTLVKRLADAMVPDAAVDTALDIVRGYEKDHGDDAPPDKRWSGAQRAEFAREALRVWMVRNGGKPDAALVNQTLEEAVGRLRLEQEAANRKLAAQAKAQS